MDGTGAAARFHSPGGVAVDSASNVYVVDTSNDTLRKITADGIVTTLAGTAGAFGSADGTGAAARFVAPFGVAVDGTGNVYVADTGNDTIRKITAGGVVTTLAGSAGTAGSADGTGTAARFLAPSSVAVDGTGNVYVADTGNDTIRKITADGIVTTLAGSAGAFGSADGTGVAARFLAPSGVAVDGTGNVYVADTSNHTIRKVTAGGVVTTLAGAATVHGAADGTGAAARFSLPEGVAVDSAGNVYVAELGNHTLRKVTADGVVTTLAGTAAMSGSADGTGATARFFRPQGVAVDSAGNVYVADVSNDSIRKVTADGTVTTLAGTAAVSGNTDGTGTDARFSLPNHMAVDGAGNIYVADAANHTIRKVTADGVVTTLAGTPGIPGSADGTGADAHFSLPDGVAIDGAGNIYVADWGNFIIRKVTADGVVTTLAGTARMIGRADGTGAAARFSGPGGMAVDSAGNVYVADRDAIRKVTAGGVVTTLAPRFLTPDGVAIDSADNIYVSDVDNHTIHKVTAAGVLTTLAGTAGAFGSADGTGDAARFHFPMGVAVDRAGNVYVADEYNHTIRKVTPTGTTTTVAGTPGVGGILLGTIPRFGFPTGLVIVGDSIIVSDTDAILLLRHGAQ